MGHRITCKMDIYNSLTFEMNLLGFSEKSTLILYLQCILFSLYLLIQIIKFTQRIYEIILLTYTKIN